MKCLLGNVALLLHLSGAVVLNTSSARVTQVRRVAGTDADGSQRFMQMGNILEDFTRAALGLNKQTYNLQHELKKMEETSIAKLRTQRLSYFNQLKKQEQVNQQIEARNMEEAKKIKQIQIHFKATVAKIREVDQGNMKQRARLQDMSQQLQQAHKTLQQAHQDAEEVLQVEDDSKPALKEQAPRSSGKSLGANDMASDTVADNQDDALPGDQHMGDANTPANHGDSGDSATDAPEVQALLSFFQVDSKQDDPSWPAWNDISISGDANTPANHGDSGDSATDAPEALLGFLQVETKQEPEDDHNDPDLQEVGGESDTPAQQPAATAGTAEKMPRAGGQTRLLHEQGATATSSATAESMVSSVSSGLKLLRDQALRGETQMKTRFEKAYKVNQKRHGALEAQSKTLAKTLAVETRRNQQAEVALKKLMATSHMLKLEIQKLLGGAPMQTEQAA